MSDGSSEPLPIPIPPEQTKEVEKLIDTAAPELARNLGKRRKEELARALFFEVQKTQVAIHSGPIPPSEELAKYDQTIPNGADRIMMMAEEQAKHRREMEKLVITSQQTQSARGQHYGFAIGLVCIIASTIMVLMGHDTAGTIFGGTTLLGLVGLFVTGKVTQKRDLQKKQTNEPEKALPAPRRGRGKK